MKYHQMTIKERCLIEEYLSTGMSYTKIAKKLGKSQSTISREVNGNGGREKYDAQKANKAANKRRKQASGSLKKLKGCLANLVESYLVEKQWSPEQISGRLKLKKVASISPEAIYQYIWRDKRQGGLLYKNLRHSGKKYNRRGASKAGRGCIPNRVDIDQRPQIVEKKIRIGDWEADTMAGARHKGAIVTLVDRTSKYAMMVNVEEKTAESVTQAILNAFCHLSRQLFIKPFDKLVHTITYDNGKEFSQHQAIAKQLKASCYFAKPYHSWERGLNEHTNGLIRQYYPKKTEFLNLDSGRLLSVQNLLNNRPRKALNFLTPLEALITGLVIQAHPLQT